MKTKRYRYFVSYTYKFGKNYIFGNNEIHTKAPIMTLNHVKLIEQFFRDQGAKHLTIIHFIFLGEFEMDEPTSSTEENAITEDVNLSEDNLTDLKS